MATSINALATITAGIRTGAIEDRGDRRILLAVNGAPVPETSLSIAHQTAARPLLDVFDTVIDLNAFTAPHVPNRWEPHTRDLPIFERVLRREWGLGDAEVELFVQSPQVPPAETLMRVFRSGPVNVISDGLMSYSPLRNPLASGVKSRLATLVYPDLLGGVTPLLMSHTAIEFRAIEPIELRSEFALAADAEDDPDFRALSADRRPTALVLGQYLSALGIISPRDELELQARLIRRAAEHGAERVLFKPHPNQPASALPRLLEMVSSLDVTVVDQPWCAETMLEAMECVVVSASFSTALATARAVYDIPIASAGTESLMRSLKPYENSNRVPLVVADSLTRDGRGHAEPEHLEALVGAVGYVMQPEMMAHLRGRAEVGLASLASEERRRYFDVRVLADLRLPGGTMDGASPKSRAMHAMARSHRGRHARRLMSIGRARATRAYRILRGR